MEDKMTYRVVFTGPYVRKTHRVRAANRIEALDKILKPLRADIPSGVIRYLDAAAAYLEATATDGKKVTMAYAEAYEA
jgi:hypothetical protein